ncbi:hypothetical protein H6F93_11345 [Leptolyngbya sp. FACHB-671]|uniref:hypothetical protein n=1 Tax=Leptolyngbya sp. FACHB-671 TaxID=2692812 RepID=UPI001685C223|nr:hypothetical protein [Leptolyngbya sp. FACHB-671]MBD2068111.1 hypothetical protein [Leptolyngbya sp. FACHB-671]
MYTEAELKKQFKSFQDARKAFPGIKARGWETLAQKLNEPSPEQLKTQVKALNELVESLKQEIEALKKSVVQPSDFDEIGFWLLDRNFDRSKFEDFDIAEDATECESAAKSVYKKLAQQYHPDSGGTDEQMANVNRLHEQMMALVKMNGGLGV